MQTSQPFIAIQKVSLEGYQRLRKALMRQTHLFESVETENALASTDKANTGSTSTSAHLSNGNSNSDSNSASVEPQANNAPQSNLKGSLKSSSNISYVLMRSPNLSVLLIATPLAAHPEGLSANQTSVELDREAAAYQVPLLQTETTTTSSKQKTDLMQAILSQALLPAAASQHERPAYQIQLSFDDHAIDEFVRQQKMSTKRNKSKKKSIDTKSINTNLDVNAAHHQQVSEHSSSNSKHRSASAKQAKVEHHTLNETAAVERNKQNVDSRPVLNHEHFTLAWAKQLADSPEGVLQETLANQVQQSLLLNQVITRIRHSLDLPAILETTVAQVREFLCADRLVVYQFEQMSSVDLSSPSSTKPFTTDTDSSSHVHSSSHIQGLIDDYSSTTDIHQSSNAIVGRCTHEGHVTYESRISKEIPSVLNLSESECFMPSLSIRDRYIMGHPIAVDDVNQKYADSQCLLNFLHQAQVKSKIIAPIIVKDQLWGLLIAHQCADYRHWQKTEILFLQHIAEHLAVAISQAALYQQLQKQTNSLESCVVERTQNLRDALLAAESANLTKGEFLSTMSHELRTPLTYIIGMSATLLRWSFGELSDRQRSYLNTINHSGEQLLEVINDILEFAKISSGRSFLEISEFSLETLVNETIEHFQSIAERKDVDLSLSLKVEEQRDLFVADEKRLQQILSNLIHNAIKFTPAGGQVTLKVWRETSGSQENTQNQDIGVFQVEDTGIGIPETQQDLLFEKFKQLESPFQRQYAGTGLGLAMTKRLVELHGGTIQVRSKVDEGSTFSVRLPSQITQSSSQRYQIPTDLVLSANRVLLIEAQGNAAAIICDLLTADGYEVIWEISATHLLTQLNSLRPAVLIANLTLLTRDVENTKEIQRAITEMDTKVLALLTQSVSESTHIAHHDTLNKPINPKKLLEKVRSLTLARQ